MRINLFCVLFFQVISWTFSYNILVMFPYPGKSHFDTFVGLFKALAMKGNNVTVISHFPLKEPVPNYRDIEIGGFERFFESDITKMLDMKNIQDNNRLMKYLTFLVLGNVGEMVCEITYTSKAVQSFLKENNKFDIALTECFNTDCFVPVAKKFNIPVIRIHSCTLMPWSSDRFGNPNNPSYIPNNFLPFSDKMTFLERLENTILTLLQNVYFTNFIVRRDKSEATKYLGEFGAALDIDIYNDSLVLVSTHFSLNLPRPLVPNVIEVGGIHVGKPRSLPKVRAASFEIELCKTSKSQG